MPAPAPDALRTATETLSRLTEYLRENPAPDEVLDLVEPLLDEDTGLPAHIGDALRALARAVQVHPDIPRTAEVRRLIAELRAAAWEQNDQHSLHYVLADLRALSGKAPASTPGYAWC